MHKILELDLPIKTISEMNNFDHWAKRWHRSQDQKRAITIGWWQNRNKIDLHFPCHIILTRIGFREMDSDNLQASLKFVRDGIAECILPGFAHGIADSDKRLSWAYKQEVRRKYGVIIEIYC